jgi:hypothetical protein
MSTLVSHRHEYNIKTDLKETEYDRHEADSSGTKSSHTTG